ncbi:MAG: hypothetical protein VYE44_08920, partial [Verrucomicrobiota bacterium]|nr:hypothetical protein [Verrucomicrobiota bacterium]
RSKLLKKIDAKGLKNKGRSPACDGASRVPGIEANLTPLQFEQMDAFGIRLSFVEDCYTNQKIHDTNLLSNNI